MLIQENSININNYVTWRNETVTFYQVEKGFSFFWSSEGGGVVSGQEADGKCWCQRLNAPQKQAVSSRCCHGQQVSLLSYHLSPQSGWVLGTGRHLSLSLASQALTTNCFLSLFPPPIKGWGLLSVPHSLSLVPLPSKIEMHILFMLQKTLCPPLLLPAGENSF